MHFASAPPRPGIHREVPASASRSCSLPQRPAVPGGLPAPGIPSVSGTHRVRGCPSSSIMPAPDTALQPGGAGGGGGWTKWPPPPARQETGQSAGAARQVTAEAGGDGLQGGSLRGEEDGPLREPGAVSRRTTSSLCAGRSAKPSQLESKKKKKRERENRREADVSGNCGPRNERGSRFSRGLLGTVVQRRRPAPAGRWDAEKRLLGSVVVCEACGDQEVGVLGGERGQNKSYTKRRGNEVGESPVSEVDYKSQSASRWGLS
ncbi:translation initiation factor IF-2-like [Cervus canadensis]|uniref:translation initiation factor IF-2-like n=1 Tax=Cervus canadensis TaxID=1574408 RepID=UPI001C9E9FA5|nr:translation initiation factor IF-2-like [Cervus canadensis]